MVIDLKSVGIICEFNPLHNGHVYFIDCVKKKFPGHVIVLALNGYFLERGEVSILSKEDKVSLALEFGVDIVCELPAVFGTQSADTFAMKSIEILNNLKVSTIVFGSECGDALKLESLALKQLNNSEFNLSVLNYLKTGINYPSALAKSVGESGFSFSPNDLLGISYIKAILNCGFNIKYDTITRTNDFHDNLLESSVVSASNIREKLNNNKSILKYIPKDYSDKLVNADKDMLFSILKVKILTDKDLTIYLDVDEGIENRLFEGCFKCSDLVEFVSFVKSKRYTFNRVNRMLMHILLGITKKDAVKSLTYTKVIGFNKVGKQYINSIKKNVDIPLVADKNCEIYKKELTSSLVYDALTRSSAYEFEKSNKPVKYDC